MGLFPAASQQLVDIVWPQGQSKCVDYSLSMGTSLQDGYSLNNFIYIASALDIPAVVRVSTCACRVEAATSRT